MSAFDPKRIFVPFQWRLVPIPSLRCGADKIGTTVRDRLQDYADGDGITCPEETYVLTARAE